MPGTLGPLGFNPPNIAQRHALHAGRRRPDFSTFLKVKSLSSVVPTPVHPRGRWGPPEGLKWRHVSQVSEGCTAVQGPIVTLSGSFCAQVKARRIIALDDERASASGGASQDLRLTGQSGALQEAGGVSRC